MADEGYEVMGPAVGVAPAPIPLAPGQKPTVAPPTAPPLAVVVAEKKEKAPVKKHNRSESESESTAEATGKSVVEKGGKGKSSMRSVMSEPGEESRMESSELCDGTAIVQRPTCLDMCQLSTVLFVTLIVTAIAIPVLLTAVGKADIKWIMEHLKANKS